MEENTTNSSMNGRQMPPYSGYTSYSTPSQPQTPPPMPPQKPPKTSMHHFGQGCLFIFIVMSALMFLGIRACTKMAIDITDSIEESSDTKISGKVLVESEKEDVVAVIDIKGIIESSNSVVDQLVSPTKIIPILNYLEEQSDVKALILDMDSPGGEVTASDEIYRAILDFKKKKKIPVITCMRSMGASGGYYIAAASDYIIANRNTFTGSIGVIMSSLNFKQLLDKIGVEPEVYKSGEMKDMLNPVRVRTEEEKKYINELINESYIAFTDIVASGRKEHFKSGEEVRKSSFADGRVLSGAAAKAAGLVDELGYFSDAVAKARKLADISDSQVIKYYSDPGWRGLFEMGIRQIPFKASNLLPWRSATLESGRLYYIAPEAIAK